MEMMGMHVFGGWYTSSDCSTGLVTTIGATDKTANFNLYAKWTTMSLDALEGGTMYYAQDMVPAGLTVGAKSQYYPGSENNMFNMRGTGNTKSATCPMYAQNKSQTVDGIDFTQAVFFRYTADVSGTTIPTHNAIQFVISHDGYLDIYCNAPKTIYMIKSGGSAAQLDASATGGAKITKAVTAGTYYLYSTNGTYGDPDAASTSERIFAMKFRPIYSVTYNANGGSGTTTDASSPYNDGSEVTTLSNSFTYSGYKFKWWNTAANGSGEDFYVGEKFNIAADANLYAQWESVASDEAFWVGDNFTFSDNVMLVGDMRVKKYNVDLNQDITQDYNQVNKQNGHAKKAKVMAMDANDEYIEIYFSDGSPIKKLYLGATSDQTTDQNIVVVYSATSDFTTAGGAAHEFKQVGENTNLVTIPGHDQTTKSVTDVSPSKDNLYTNARIYRRIGDANSVFDNTSNLGTENKLRIYSIKAKKGTYSYSITYDCDGADSGCPSNATEQTALPNPLPDAPLKSGYMFDGWYTNSGKTDAAVAGATLTGNTTLYAKWIALSEKCVETNHDWTEIAYAHKTSPYEGVTYDLGGINDDASSITLTPAEGEGYVHFDISSLGIIKEIKITLSGVGETNAEKGLYYAFDKTFWNYHEDYTKTDGHYFNLSGSEVIRLHPTGDATKCTFSTYGTTVSISEFCIYYEPASYTLTWSTDGDVLTGDYTSGTVAYGTPITAPNTPTKTGYTFDAWSPTPAATMPAANTTYTATWTADSYTITLNKGDHGAANQSASVSYDATSLTSITHVTSTGYDRTGYYDGETKVLNADGSFAGDNITGYITSGKWSKTSDATLTAKWEAYCFEATITKTSGSYTLSTGSGETKDITSDATVTSGGAVKLVNNYAGSKSFSFSSNGVAPGTSEGYVEIVFPSGSALGVGSIIRITGAGSAADEGLLLIDDEGNTIASQTKNGAIDFTYTVTTGSALKYKDHIRIARAKTNSNNYFKSVSVLYCASCAPYTPTLTYSKTTIWMDDESLTASPTLNKDGSTGSATYISNNTDVATVDPSTGVVTAVARGTATIIATIAADGTHCDKSATCDITVKSEDCGNTTIAKATRSGSSASYTGLAGGSALVDNLDGTSYKLTSGGYVGVQLPSTLSFEAGDIVRIDLTIGDWWNGAKADELPVVVYADNTGTNEIYRTDNYTKLTAQVVEFEVTSSMLTALATKQVTVYRKSSTETQNHVVNSVEVKRYSCPDSKEFLPTGDDGNWNATANWIGEAGRGASLPTIDDRVIISKPVTVDIADAKAQGVLINQYSGATGKVTVSAGKALIIADKLQKTTTGSDRVTTAAADVIINSTRAAGTGALVIGGETGTNAATVNFETKVKRESGTGNWINQFIGSPFSDLEPYVDYALQIYAFRPNGLGNRGYWNSLSEGDEMEEFVGHNILYNDNDYLDVQWTGKLNASSNEKTLTGYYGSNTYSLFANSWVAPIHIGSFESTDFANMDATIYIFNAGTPQQEKEMGDGNGAKTAAGTYAVIPISSSEWIEGTLEVIPAMQAFFVNANAASPSLTLDYSKLVYTPALTSVGITPTRAPRRSTEEEAPEVIRLRVAGENGWAETTYLLGREDFTEGFDNGWDGRYMEGEDTNPQLYAPTSDGNMAVNCVPQIEGTVLGFRKGNADSQYTFSFEYTGEEEYYLKDLKLDIETRIDNESTYAFTAEAGDNAARFIIVRKTPAIATGVDNVDGEGAKVRKLIINDKVYIIRGGQIYSVDGALVVPMMEQK